MTDMNTRFCRVLFAQAKLDLTGRELAHFRVNAGCLKMSGMRGWYLVEWPKADKNGGTFALEIQASNANHAKAQAINKWLEHHAPSIRARGGLTGK